MLSEKQLDQALAHIKDCTTLGAPDKGCPACNSNSFSIGEQMIFARGLSSDGGLDANSGAAYVRVICNECSHTLLFDAMCIDRLDLDV